MPFRSSLAEDRILLTFDKDFGELAFRTKLPAASGIILFRITAPSSAVVAQKVVVAIVLRTARSEALIREFQRILEINQYH